MAVFGRKFSNPLITLWYVCVLAAGDLRHWTVGCRELGLPLPLPFPCANLRLVAGGDSWDLQ